MSTGIIVILIAFIILIVISFITYIIFLFNGIVRLKNQISKSWGNIDVLLKQRSDELPNVIATVKSYAKYEKNLFSIVVQARKDLLMATNLHDKAVASDSITTSLKSIFAFTENYPQLKANQSFLELQERLSQIENEIAERREFFNDSVTLYNNRIQSFPDLIIANILKYKPEQLFSASEEEKEPVIVKENNQ